MTEIIDLNLLVQEPIKFKGTDGKVYTIPGGISTEFVLKLMAYHNAINALDKQEKILEKMREIVVDILNLDKDKDVDMDYVKKHFDDMNILTAIINIMMDHIEKVSANPNSPSPQSQESEA